MKGLGGFRQKPDRSVLCLLIVLRMFDRITGMDTAGEAE